MAPPPSFQVAQLYVDNPLLISGRKFGLRLWVVLVGADPLRAYIHKNGLVLFASEPYDPDAVAAQYVNGCASTGAGPLTAAGACAPSGGGDDDDDDDFMGFTEAAGGSNEDEDGPELPSASAHPSDVSETASTVPAAGGGGGAPLGHVTNYAQNVDGDVWSLQQLREKLGQKRFRWEGGMEGGGAWFHLVDEHT